MYLGLPLFPSVPLTRWFSLHSLRLDFSPHCFTLSQFASSFFPQWVSYKVTSHRPLSTQTKPGQSVPWYKDNKFALILIFFLSIHPLFSLEHNSPCVCELFEGLNFSFWWGLNFFHLLWPAHCYSRTDSSSSLAGLRQQFPRTDIQTFFERKVCSFAEMLSHSAYLQKKADMCDTNVDLSEHGTEKKNLPHKNQQCVKFLVNSMLLERQLSANRPDRSPRWRWIRLNVQTTSTYQ